MAYLHAVLRQIDRITETKIPGAECFFIGKSGVKIRQYWKRLPEDQLIKANINVQSFEGRGIAAYTFSNNISKRCYVETDYHFWEGEGSLSFATFAYVYRYPHEPVKKVLAHRVYNSEVKTYIKYRAKSTAEQDVAEAAFDSFMPCYESLIKYNGFGLGDKCESCEHQFSCLTVRDRPGLREDV